MFNSTKKKVAVIAVAAATLGTVGAAAAAFNWTSSGNGDGSAVAHVQTINITASTPTEDASLYPGNATGSNVSFKIDNPSLYQVTVSSVVAHGAITSDMGSCGAADVDFTPSLTGATGNVVNGGATGQVVTLLHNLKLHADASNTCQGATFTIPVTVTATQSAATQSGS
jgi:hypothetical protein